MSKRKTGFTCSCFDLLHAGHIAMLREAKEHCDYLLCGLQTDPTIDRPNTKNKLLMLKKLKYKYISYCFYFSCYIYTSKN